MPVITKLIQRQESVNKTGIPTIISWKNAKMVRGHSVNSIAHEIMTMSENSDMISLMFIGKQGSGKTELMRTLSHLIAHKFAKLHYNISFFGKEELLDFENTINKLTPTNQIIILDDIAFLKASASTQKMDQVQQILGYIRHLPGGKDVRIILMKAIQYSKSIPPFLRQSDMTFLSTVDDSEIKNLLDLFGKHSSEKIALLKRLRASVVKGNDFVFPIGRKGTFAYKAKDPFLPFLVNDGERVKFIVSPLRTWIDPICQKCAPSIQTSQTKINLENFVNDFSKHFGKGIAKRAVELRLLLFGIHTQPKKVLQAQKFLDKVFDTTEINLEELSLAYGLTERKTRLCKDKQPQIIEVKNA